jgi:hypothetical protein
MVAMSYFVRGERTDREGLMTKRDRPHDTQPMLNRPPQPEDVADVTVPTGLADPTDPGPAPTFTTPAAPSDPAPTEEQIEASNLLAGFKRRPPRPPAPRPKVQASSDGGDFVAYSTVARPAPRTAQEDARARARVEVARLAAAAESMPPADGAMVAGRDAPTQLVTFRRNRRRAVRIVAGIGAVVAVGGALAIALTLGTGAAGTPSSASSALAATATTLTVISTPSTTASAPPIETQRPQTRPEVLPPPPPVASAPVVPVATSRNSPGASRPPPQKQNNSSTERFSW